MKTNRLLALVATHACPASTENEEVSAYRKARDMVTNELNCPQWVSACVITFLAKKDVWFPTPEKETNRPVNAMQMVENALIELNFKYSTIDYDMGGKSIVAK